MLLLYADAGDGGGTLAYSLKFHKRTRRYRYTSASSMRARANEREREREPDFVGNFYFVARTGEKRLGLYCVVAAVSTN